ncbi:MAG TPA: SDR family oxidoreductase [Longimicrobium sp.]|nr:SDR family oxidoreductase [Longimicrobium sp.]
MESISTFSEAELRGAGVDPAYLSIPGYVNRGCVLDDVDLFDAGFFGYSARDAETIDPQQRVFMELAWESLEDAGYNPDAFPGLIGVFAGSDQSSYLYHIYQHIDLSAFGYGGMMAIGNEKDYVATQVSYKLNLRGPSMAIQTSCSTSLVTVCMACQSLLSGACDMALAGGVAIQVPQRRGYWFQPGGIVSSDGHCRPFDASAQGTVVGNGVGIVVLKRLSEALADGDRIHAVIKGFGLNNDGSAKVGYTAPSIDGQTDAIRRAHRMAGVEPSTIGYVEAHGTATALGDPVELSALTRAFRERTDAKQFCAVGSVKSNVGHLSSSAGVTGLIKAILAVEHGRIPGTVHYSNPNPHIDFASSPFMVAAETMEWPLNGGPRRAGVSSFGVGGTNAHVVLEQAPELARDERAQEKQLLVLSARSQAALETMTDNLVERLEGDPELDLADVAFTLQVGRRVFPHRRALPFDRSDREGTLEALRTRDPVRLLSAVTEPRDRPVVFMFSGQGTQYVDMGRGLYDTEPTFRAHLDACAEILKEEMGEDLRDLLFPCGDRDQAQARLTRTSITQPALFTVEYALARTWMEWGVTPRAMMGHSIGEYVAACLAGVMELADALPLVAMRGRLMETMPAGSMMAVSLPEAALRPLLGPHLSLAAVNGPALCVLSGLPLAVDALEAQFSAQGLVCRRLHTSHAFHSAMMEPVVAEFVERLGRVKLKAPAIPYLSNVTGSWITPELATSPQYWGTHLRQTVRFADNVREALVLPDPVLLEVGPGQALCTLARQQAVRGAPPLVVGSMRPAQEPVSDDEVLRGALAQLWLGGARIDWAGVHVHESRRRVPLPTYPFDRQRFWLGPIEQPAAEGDVSAVATGAPSDAASYSTIVPSLTTGFAAPASAAPRSVDDFFFAPGWRPAAARGGGDPAEAGPWLVFGDPGGLCGEVARRLRESGAGVVTAAPGDDFVDGDEHFVIRVGEREDYERMVQALRERERSPRRVLHLGCADPAPAGLTGPEAFDEAQARGFYSVMYLARALGGKGGSAPVQVAVVTEGLQSITGDEALRSLEGTVLGAAKVVGQEYPHLRCRLVDVPRAHDGAAEALVRELTVEPFAPVVAYRNGRRWTQHYEPVAMEAPPAAPALLRDGGVYLVTGGLGNIGLVLAEAIARQVKARLVLCGRSELPDRAAWDEHLAARGPAAGRIRAVRALEALGSEVWAARADVTRRDDMVALLDEVAERWGGVDGVIHGAANLAPDAFGPVRDLDEEKGGAHFRPKAHGLLVLEELLRDRPPAFWVLLSSLSAVLGGLNLAAYAASNAFLDAEAQRRGEEGSAVWITTNWDAWDFAAAPGARTEGITAAQGGDAFVRILAAAPRQVVVSATPLGPRLDQWVNLPDGRLAGAQAAAPQAAAAGATHPRPALSTQFVPPRTATETTIAGVWEHLLGVTPIGVNDRFFELGGHSLLAIQLLARLREIYDVDLPVQRIFEAPTVAQLAEGIDRDLQAGGSARSAAADPQDRELAEMLSLVEGLSEAELDELLREAENLERSESHA